MKKFLSFIVCAILSIGTANAQLADILNQMTSVANKSTSSNGALNALSQIITSKLVPTSTQIVGTWKYQKPAVMFTSSNALKNTASTMLSSSLETKLQSYLTKIGIRPGKTSFTFNSNKTFTINRNGTRIASGTYALSGSEVVLTFKGRKNPCRVTPQLSNGSLIIVMDATKLKTFMQNIGANVTQLSAIVALMKQMDGLKIGVRLTK